MSVLSFDDLLAGRSLSQVADEFATSYRPKPPDKSRNARSILQELRRLRDGKPKWFAKRPEAARLLAKILGCALSDLGLSSGGHAVPFVDFPAAEPLDLQDPKDAPFFVEAWLGLLESAQSKPVWFSSGPGTGKSTFARWAEARGHAARIDAPTLGAAEAAIVETSGLLVVDLGRVDTGDFPVLVRIQRKELVVLAPAPRPRRDNNPGEWIDLGWSATAFDRRGFVNWLLRRAGDDAPHPQRTWRKIDEFDPDGVLLTTPDDIVQFIGAIYEDRRAVANGVLRRAAASIRSDWLGTHGREVFRALALARWRDLRFGLDEAASPEVWAGYVPTDLVAPMESSALIAELRAVQRSNQDPTDLAERLLRDAGTTVRLLEQARLLVQVPGTGSMLRPRWLAVSDIHDHVRTALVEDPGAVASVAVDPARRMVLDRVAETLDDAGFKKFVKRCAGLARRDDLGAIGAIEIAFAAVARRSNTTNGGGDRPSLERIARRQIELLIERTRGGVEAPVTRPGPGFLGGDAFVADCWQWSVLVDRPPGIQVEPWLFPGWLREAPDEIPNWLHGLAMPRGGEDAARRLALVVGILFSRWPAKEWSRLPQWMVPVVLALPDERPVSDEDSLELLVENVASALRRAFDGAPTEQRTQILRRLWAKLPRWELYNVIRVLDGPMGDVLLATADPDVLARGAAKWAVAAPVHDLGRVPAVLRGPIVRWLLSNAPDRAGDLRRQVDHLGAEEADCLVELANGEGGWLAVHRLWQVAPDRARDELTKRIAAHEDAAQWLEAPVSATSSILELVEAEQKPLPASLRRWSARRLLDAPTLAERLLPLARTSAT